MELSNRCLTWSRERGGAQWALIICDSWEGDNSMWLGQGTGRGEWGTQVSLNKALIGKISSSVFLIRWHFNFFKAVVSWRMVELRIFYWMCDDGVIHLAGAKKAPSETINNSCILTVSRGNLIHDSGYIQVTSGLYSDHFLWIEWALQERI